MLLAVILGTTAYGWDSIRVASPISKTDRFALHTQPPTGWATAPSTAFNLIQMAPSGLPPRADSCELGARNWTPGPPQSTKIEIRCEWSSRTYSTVPME